MEKYNEFEDYWTNNKTIIFKPDFDELDDNYYEIIDKHAEIFFTHYNNISDALKQKNNENYLNYKYYIGSKFNQEIKLPEGLKSVIFGHNFNKKIKLPEGLKSVKFGLYFNQKIELPKELQIVEFGSRFNQEIKLPEGLEIIKFGENFNQKIKLPDKLESVIFGRDFNQKIKLPDKLESVIFGRDFNQKIKLPEGLKSVKFDNYFDQEIRLPEGLKSAKIGECFSRKIKLPIELKVISINTKFKLNLLSNNLKKINITCYYGFNLNKNINYITNKIQKICVSNPKNTLKNLPNSVKFIVFGNKKEQKILNKYVSLLKISVEYLFQK